MAVTLPNQWRPRPYQQALWNYLSEGGLRASIAWHRRSGKDDLCLHHAACASQERVGGIWHLLPEYSQARKSIWDAVNPHTGKRRIDEAFPLDMREVTRENEMLIKFKNGSTWQLAGSDNYNALVGSSPCGLVFSEYALANPSAWAYLRPIVLENKGWAVFISTPRGKNHFYDLHQAAAHDPAWFHQSLSNDETQVFAPQQMRDELREMQAQHGEQYGASFFQQEYHVSFDAAIMGSIWGDCVDTAVREGRITNFPLDPAVPVYTAWDLGRTDDTAIWFYQMNGTNLDIFDHHASNTKDIPFYVQLLQAKRRQHGFTYATHWLPHDARPRTLAAGGKSILQQFHDAALLDSQLGKFSIGPRLDKQEGIQAARKTFPHCRFHATRCAEGLESLKHYHREWDAEHKVFLTSPAHDHSSHNADAFRYLSLSWKYQHPAQPDSPLIDRLLQTSISHMNFGQLREKHFAKRRSDREWSSLS